MKYFFIILIMIVSSISIFGQNKSVTRYYEELEKSKTLQDTIVSWLTYKITSIKNNDEAIRLLDETLLETYPKWVEIEKSLLIQEESNSTENLLIAFTEQANNITLQKYGLAQLNSLKILEGKSDKIDYSIFKNPPSDDKDAVFDYYLMSHQFNNLGQADSLVMIVEKIDEIGNNNIYPALQLNILRLTLRKIMRKIDDQTYPYFDKAFALSESLEESNQLIDNYTSKMIYLKSTGDYINAMKIGSKIVELVESSGDIERTVIAYNNLSSFLQEQGRFEEAYNLVYKSRNLALTTKDSVSVLYTLASEASIKMNEKKYNEAISIFKKVRNYGGDYPDNLEAFIIINLIDSYYTIGKLDSAFYYYNEYEEMDPNNEFGYLDYAKTFVSKYLIEKKEYGLAQEYIDHALSEAETYNDLSSKSLILLAQSELDEALGDYKQALLNYKEHAMIELDFRNEDLASTITKITLENKFKKEKEIQDLVNEKERVVITSERNKAIFLVILTAIAALSSFSFYLLTKRKNRQINIQNQELEQLNTTKDNLFQIIGHDMKKPTINFRNISRNINYLLEKEDYDRLKSLGQEINKDANSLYSLTDNLLNWALIQKDIIAIKPQDVNVYEVIQSNIEVFSPLASRKNISLNNYVDKSTYSKVDKNSLDTIIRNLIDNAIKYTPESGTVSIGSMVKEGLVHISIIDDGIGIDNTFINKLEEGLPIKSRDGTDGEKGSGLGFLLIKQLIKRNKGRIEIKKSSGKGSEINIILPNAR